MMILRSSPPSPFGRKVKIVASVLGLMEKITIENTDTNDPKDSIRTQNPLGKIPALITNDTVLYDSRVIVEYLDDLAGRDKIIPVLTTERFQCLTRAALMDGLLDAAILIVYEDRFRPENMRLESFVEYQRDKLCRGLAHIGENLSGYAHGAMPDIGEITLACLIDYLDYRKQLDWRDYAPQIAGWMGDFAQNVPGYRESLPPDIDPAPWR